MPKLQRDGEGQLTTKGVRAPGCSRFRRREWRSSTDLTDDDRGTPERIGLPRRAHGARRRVAGCKGGDAPGCRRLGQGRAAAGAWVRQGRWESVAVMGLVWGVESAAEG